MGIDSIREKSKALGKTKPSVLKINMYENPQMALDLIAHICTASRDLDVDHCFDDFESILTELNNKIDEKEYPILKDSFLPGCREVVNTLILSLLADVSTNLKVAVAGGFSAGKSTLLNALTGIGSLLPTGIEPVSMINTNLNCSTTCSNLIVRGVNLKGDVVLLNKDVLACVQHASKSKVYVASVLNRIIMDVPTPEAPYLNGVTFIDTPGYDNSHETDEEHKSKDVDLALNAIKEADVLFWCIDIQKGAVPENDLRILKQIRKDKADMPIVLFFTKMDRKPEKDAERIMEQAAELCEKELKRLPDDVIGVSCWNNSVTLKSLSKHTINEVFRMIQRVNGTLDCYQLAENQIQSGFDEIIRLTDDLSSGFESDREASVKRKQALQQQYNEAKKRNKTAVETLKRAVLGSYDEILGAKSKMEGELRKSIKGWRAALEREDEWEKKAGLLKDTTSLSQKKNEATPRFNEVVEQFNKLIKIDGDFGRGQREDICKDLELLLGESVEKTNKERMAEEERTKQLMDNIQKEAELRTLMLEYRPKVLQTLKKCYDACKAMIMEHMNKLQQLPIEKDDDVFSAIHADNFKRFLACFSNGVDMNQYDSEGYSPLTLACRMGNNEMVKFFIRNEVDLSKKDGRGYNSLETAAINNFRDICELLYAADRSLVGKSASLVELSKKNTFTEWISKL